MTSALSSLSCSFPASSSTLWGLCAECADKQRRIMRKSCGNSLLERLSTTSLWTLYLELADVTACATRAPRKATSTFFCSRKRTGVPFSLAGSRLGLKYVKLMTMIAGSISWPEKESLTINQRFSGKLPCLTSLYSGKIKLIRMSCQRSMRVLKKCFRRSW